MKFRVRLFSVLLAVLLPVSLCLSVAAAESAGLDNFKKVQTYTDGTFQDVKATDWFCENVKSVYELGLMVGNENALFDTQSNMTVSEAMTIAARLHAIYQTGNGTFTQGQPWYQVYADYCQTNGIADPSLYNMNAPVTRAQFAVIFANALPKEALEAINTVEENAIPDVKSGESCADAVYQLYRAGILTGNDKNGTFAPDSNIIRVEAAAIVTRMAEPALRQTVTLTVQPTAPQSGDDTDITVEFEVDEDEEEEVPID